MFLAITALSGIAHAQDELSQARQAPLFRSGGETARPEIDENLPVKLVTDTSFAPYSFVSSAGSPAGMAVEIAIAACERARLKCTVRALPFSEILGALTRGEADAAVTGPRLDEATLRDAVATRPYFRVMARFATRTDSALAAADAEALSGSRIGVTKDTQHARWLESYYGGSSVELFDSLTAAGQALKAGEVDAIFGDNLQVIYWTAGQAAEGCCKIIGGTFSDLNVISRNLAFLVRRDRPELVRALDYGLDQAEASGATARILGTYVPLPLW